MLSDIAAAVGPTISVAPVSASALPDVYEAYVFALTIKAARAEGATIAFLDRKGASTSSLILRTSPGFIFSSAKNYTHALITFPKCPPLEAHVGIKVVGKSNVLHEIDVAVLWSDAAATSRSKKRSPGSSSVLLGIECKFYASVLQLHLARAFLGLVSDVSIAEPFFVSNTASRSVDRLLSHRARHGWEKNITPSCTNNEVDRFVYALRSFFKNFKAT